MYLKTPEDLKHSDSDHPPGISGPFFCNSSMWMVGEDFLNHCNIGAVLYKGQPGDSPQENKQYI